MKNISTPICSFVEKYAADGIIRMHMPAHKGRGGAVEKYDITEISGADSLYEAYGIIRESELAASGLFGADTYYSTEGSSLSIRAMIYLISCYARLEGKRARIAAGRNAHRAFVSAISLLDVDVDWLIGENESYLSCVVSAEKIKNYLDSCNELPIAVYITSPDYLGNMLDVSGIARVCHERGVFLAVDNAHGAYLKFLPESNHPIDLGADIVCDSAHKTLPVLTGGAYLHISKSVSDVFSSRVKNALALFGSTSPSYLILESLDAANSRLAGGFSDELEKKIKQINILKSRLTECGYVLVGDEPMKITLSAKRYGYRGDKFAEMLRRGGVECEFADPDFTVLMPSVDTSEEELMRIGDLLVSMPKRDEIELSAPKINLPRRVITPREAMLLPSENVCAEEAEGRVLASVTVGCPPAVPIVISGELIDRDAVRCFEYYGIKTVCAVKKEYI